MKTRRMFLGELGAVGAGFLVGGCEVEDVVRFVDDSRTVARLGVMANTEVGWITETRPLERALRYYRQEGVDAVAIAGGLTRNGYANQMEVLQKVWQKVFGGTNVRLLTEEGRYEVNGFSFGIACKTPAAKCDVLTFHGEGKHALTDDVRFYDRTYRAVYAGTMSGIVVRPGYEYCGRTGDDVRVNATQGLLVGVYSSQIVIRRLDFAQTSPADKSISVPQGRIYAEQVADPLVLPRDLQSPLTAGEAPRFWDDTRLQVLPGFQGAERVFTVRWPNVLKCRTGERAYAYEVCAHLLAPGSGKPSVPFVRRTVLPKGFMLAEVRDQEPATALFKASDLDIGGQPFVISVLPIGTRGERGKPVYSEPIRL